MYKSEVMEKSLSGKYSMSAWIRFSQPLFFASVICLNAKSKHITSLLLFCNSKQFCPEPHPTSTTIFPFIRSKNSMGFLL